MCALREQGCVPRRCGGKGGKMRKQARILVRRSWQARLRELVFIL
jgi:hypothetical protein